MLMSLDNLRLDLFDIQKNIINSLSEDPWSRTLSGKIYKGLEIIANKLSKPLHIENKGGVHERFQLGTETASLYKRLIDGTVGEDDGSIQSYAECWEYKNYSWWKEALDLEKIPVVLLDTPVINLVMDAQVSHADNYFLPSAVVQNFHLNPKRDLNCEIVMQDWVKHQIKEVLNPLLYPDYDLVEYENKLRLNPLTPEAKLSRTSDNDAYGAAKKKIPECLKELSSRYEARGKTPSA